jgi:hypothetical protein
LDWWSIADTDDLTSRSLNDRLFDIGRRHGAL